jgi:hypothetical protein
MFHWGEYLIVARPHNFELYMMPSDGDPPLDLQTLPFGRFAWEIFIYEKLNTSPLHEGLFPRQPRSMDADAMVFILMFAKGGIYLYTLSEQPVTSSISFQLRLVGQYDLTRDYIEPAWGLNVGACGHRITFFKGKERYFRTRDEAPTLNSANFRLPVGNTTYVEERTDALIDPPFDIGNADLLPSLWGLATTDFDEAIGLLAVGNVFGELAICDYVGLRRDSLSHIANVPPQDAAELTTVSNVRVHFSIHLSITSPMPN